MSELPANRDSLQTARTTVRRRGPRGRYDPVLVHALIDEALVCHLAFVSDGVPIALPTIHARIGDVLYVHGAMGNHMLKAVLAGGEVSVTVSLIDGLVFARSAFHHSMNYRSVVVIGAATEVTAAEEKLAAMSALVEKVAPGRMAETRPPAPEELKTTRVLKLPIVEASAKVRGGPAVDAEADLGGQAWAGVLPLKLSAGALQRDALLPAALPVPAAVATRAAQLGAAHERIWEWQRGEHLVSSDRSRLDVHLVHSFLSEQSYWARGVSRDALERSLKDSYCFGLYAGGQQLGFARVVSDGSRFAFLADVFVREEARGRGLGRWLVECVLAAPGLSDVQRWLLGTRDAHGLYERYGFEIAPAGRYMLRLRR